jgi:hypothetical protein
MTRHWSRRSWTRGAESGGARRSGAGARARTTSSGTHPLPHQAERVQRDGHAALVVLARGLEVRWAAGAAHTRGAPPCRGDLRGLAVVQLRSSMFVTPSAIVGEFSAT